MRGVLAGCSPPSFLGTDLSKHDFWQNEGRLDFSVRWHQFPLWLNLSDPSLLLYNQPAGVLFGLTNTPSALLLGLGSLFLQSSWLLLAQDPWLMVWICSLTCQCQPWPLLWPLVFASTSELSSPPKAGPETQLAP